MTALEQLQKRADESPVTMADLKALLTEVRELETWIQTSNRVLTSRINRIARKTDSAYVFGSNEGAIRQELAELQKKQKQTETILQKMMLRK
jgi:uncharacterized protein (DUF1697 family)